ncbi:Pls/PosA family non-ribosomal peptide synthetase [Streptomyces sp. NPDC001514]
MTGKSVEVPTAGRATPVASDGSCDGKRDRSHDRSHDSGRDGGRDGQAAGTARLLAEVLAQVVRVEQVPLDSHFFHDLGADSLVMAQFCARVRKRAQVPPVSMKDIYRHPTIRSLATALTPAEPAAPALVPSQACEPADRPAGPPAPSPASSSAEASAEASAGPPAPASPPASPPAEAPGVEVAAPAAGRDTDSTRTRTRTRTRRYVVCGALQFGLFLGYCYLAALAAARGYMWVTAASGPLGVYLRSAAFAGGGFLALCALPVLAKWVLIGRWQPREFPVWSLAYLRFWLVKTLLRTSPMRLLTASPLYVPYLRALGARIGRGAVIFSTQVPVCTDLLTIGDGAVIRKDVLFSGYRAEAGMILTGSITLGHSVLVGEQTVLDIGTQMGEGAQLGHASSLHPGQTVPDGERWHGSPAQPTDVDHRPPAALTTAPAGCGMLRKALYSAGQLLILLAVYLPLVFGGVSVLVAALPQSLMPQAAGWAAFRVTGGAFLLDAAALSFVLFFGTVLVGLLVAFTVPRLLNLFVKPDTVYPLYGFHYGIQRAITLMTNRKFFTTLFGDSSAIVHYLRCLGYGLAGVEQTGSNFGTEIKHDSPYLSTVGSATMVADGLSVINAEVSSTSFRLSRASIGPRSFLGNRIAYPARARIGDDCLLATKVMVPIDGPVREGVGLLGSPSFEIPRTVLRDNQFHHLSSGEELHGRLAAKNRHNATTAGLYLLVRWIHFFVLTLIALGAARLYPRFGVPVIALAAVLALVFTAFYFVLIERAGRGFRALKPLYCSIYEPSFWRHERFWKMASVDYIQAFDGTPFKSVIWRMLGARIGRRLFDDGCFFPERTLVTVGDDCTLNAGTVIQCHSQEDGAFKSDHTTLGAGVTLGAGAFVHYGATIGDGAVLACDSFLMKGEEVPAHQRWGANPARPLHALGPDPQPQARRAGNDHRSDHHSDHCSEHHSDDCGGLNTAPAAVN